MDNQNFKAILDDKARISLGFYPTPFHRLDNLSDLLNISLYIKREDFSGQSLFGGNKIRKLEYILGDAKAQGTEYVLTYGATQSNHAMQTTAACRKIGLKPILYLLAIVESDEAHPRSNLLLDRILDAEVYVVKKHPGESNEEAGARMAQLGKAHIDRLRAEGRVCYEVPKGGSSAIGTAGFIRGYVELQEQLDHAGIEADFLYHATGTGSTMAGLAAGKKVLKANTKIVSVEVMRHPAEYAASCAKLGNEALAWLGMPALLEPEDFNLDPDYYAPGYEIPNEAGTRGIKTLAVNEGLLVDPVYSGKAFGAMLDHVRTGKIPPGSNVVFLHTGGATALFAEKEILGHLF